MIRGRFTYVGRPILDGYVIIPELELDPIGTIPFRFDTGSDTTCIHPYDASRLGIPIENLVPTREGRGIGGTMPYATFSAVIGFHQTIWPWQKPQLLVFDVELSVALPSENNWNLPSLLGRDIIDRFDIRYNRLRNRLNCRPHSTDYVVNL